MAARMADKERQLYIHRSETRMYSRDEVLAEIEYRRRLGDLHRQDPDNYPDPCLIGCSPVPKDGATEPLRHEAVWWLTVVPRASDALAVNDVTARVDIVSAAILGSPIAERPGMFDAIREVSLTFSVAVAAMVSFKDRLIRAESGAMTPEETFVRRGHYFYLQALHRQDPNSIHYSPIPLQMQALGADAADKLGSDRPPDDGDSDAPFVVG